MQVPRLYPKAQNRILFPDTSTDSIDPNRLQLCFHTMGGFQLGSESQWKTNGANGIRSHLGIAGPADKNAGVADGTVFQWNALNRVAYAQNGGNPYCISVETSDGAHNGLPWSEAQLDSIVDLIVWFTHLCGKTQPKLASTPGEFGTITYHQQFGLFNIHGHDCPGSIRRGQLTTIAIPRAVRAMVTGGNRTVADDIQALKDLINHDAAIIINGDTGPDLGHASNLSNIRKDIKNLNTKIDDINADINVKLDQILANQQPPPPPQEPSNEV